MRLVACAAGSACRACPVTSASVTRPGPRPRPVPMGMRRAACPIAIRMRPLPSERIRHRHDPKARFGAWKGDRVTLRHLRTRTLCRDRPAPTCSPASPRPCSRRALPGVPKAGTRWPVCKRGRLRCWLRWRFEATCGVWAVSQREIAEHGPAPAPLPPNGRAFGSGADAVHAGRRQVLWRAVHANRRNSMLIAGHPETPVATDLSAADQAR